MFLALPHRVCPYPIIPLNSFFSQSEPRSSNCHSFIIQREFKRENKHKKVCKRDNDLFLRYDLYDLDIPQTAQVCVIDMRRLYLQTGTHWQN